MKGFILLPVAVATAVVLWVSAAGAAGLGGPLAQSAIVAKPHVQLADTSAALPRSLVGVDGVPAKGSYAFLLKLKTVPTGVAYYANLPEGRTAASSAAHDQIARVQAAESRVISALPSGTHVLYQTHAVLSGVAVYTNVANVPALQRISGVAHIYPIAAKSLSNSLRGAARSRAAGVAVVRGPRRGHLDRGHRHRASTTRMPISAARARLRRTTPAHARPRHQPADPSLVPDGQDQGLRPRRRRVHRHVTHRSRIRTRWTATVMAPTLREPRPATARTRDGTHLHGLVQHEHAVQLDEDRPGHGAQGQDLRVPRVRLHGQHQRRR